MIENKECQNTHDKDKAELHVQKPVVQGHRSDCLLRCRWNFWIMFYINNHEAIFWNSVPPFDGTDSCSMKCAHYRIALRGSIARWIFLSLWSSPPLLLKARLWQLMWVLKVQCQPFCDLSRTHGAIKRPLLVFRSKLQHLRVWFKTTWTKQVAWQPHPLNDPSFK